MIELPGQNSSAVGYVIADPKADLYPILELSFAFLITLGSVSPNIIYEGLNREFTLKYIFKINAMPVCSVMHLNENS